MSTHISVLLDRSGSMSSIKAAMEEAFNAFVQDQKSGPDEVTVGLTQFDTVNPTDLVYRSLPIKEVPKLNIEPRGGTPLYDAIHAHVAHLQADLEASLIKPDKILFVIITDGEENSSRTADSRTVKVELEKLQGKGWNIVYLGANQDAFAEAAKIGVPVTSTLNYNATAQGTKLAGQSLSTYTSTLRSVGNASFSDADQQ